MKGEEGLDLADDFATGGVGFERLVEKSKEGAPHAKDALAAVGALVLLGEQARRQERSQQQFQMAETLLAEALNPAAQGGQAGTEGRKKRRRHTKYIYLLLLDRQLKMRP